MREWRLERVSRWLSDKVVTVDVRGLHNGLDAVRPRAQICANPYGVPLLGNLRLRAWLDDLDTVQGKRRSSASVVVDDAEPEMDLPRIDCNVRDEDAGDDQVILWFQDFGFKQ